MVQLSIDLHCSIGNIKPMLKSNSLIITNWSNFRNAVQSVGLDFIVSYRGLLNIKILEQNSKLKLDLILKSCLFKHLEKDDLKTIFDNMKITIYNKYATQMAKMIK